MEEIFSALSDGQTPPNYRYWDGAQWKTSSSGNTLRIVSPVDNAPIGTLTAVTPQEADKAIAAAKAAQPAWEATPLHKRVKIMHLAADWIRHYADYLTDLLVAEIGKTGTEAKGEIVRTADLIDYFADEALSIRGETLDSDNFPGFDKGRVALVERAAHGVVLAIAPFNYPVNLAASKIAPALLMGNSVVFKTPTQGGISGVHLTAAFIKAGVPENVLVCLTGSGSELGTHLVGHRDMNMIAFTGSSETGCLIAQKTAMIPLLFECGGNNPAIILPDADMGLAAREIVKGAFSYAGQRCTGIKYVVAPPAVLATLIPMVISAMDEMVSMGNPRDAATKLVGPVISETAAEAIVSAVERSVAAGAKLLRGGKRAGTYVEPTVLTGVTPDMSVVATEVFGPVLSFVAAASADEAIRCVNGSVYGLQACVFTKDEGAGLAVAKRLAVGTVQLNGSPQRGPDHFPFMGIKQSGVGVQGVRYSLEAMSRIRSTVINSPA